MVMQKIARELIRPFRQLHRAAGGHRRSNPAVVNRRAPSQGFPEDFTSDEIATIRAVVPCTMTSYERIVSLIRATEHVARSRIEGDIVECGVWKGGSMMAVALTLQRM